MATPTGGFPLGLVAYPSAENQGENLGFLAQLGEFEALPPAAVAPQSCLEYNGGNRP